MSAAIIAAIILVLLPAVIGWCVLLRSLYEIARERRESDIVKDYAALVKAKPRLTEIERRRALKAWSAKHANAEVVKLTGNGPQRAA